MAQFRFEDLEIWKLGSEIGNSLFDIANDLNEQKKFRFAEQLNGAAMSITNNIAEGSGSYSNKEFANFINMSRRSVFECANIISILHKREYVSLKIKESTLNDLEQLSKMLTNFRKTLINKL